MNTVSKDIVLKNEMKKMTLWVGCSHESSEVRPVNGKEGMAYRMDRDQMSLDRQWERG